jgi:hypothetical protein
MKESTKINKTQKQTKVPFFALKREGKALVIKTSIKSGAGAQEQTHK